MEFFLYLTPVGNQIISSLAKAKYKIQENIEFCRDNTRTFGYLEYDKKKFVVCTSNIKNGGWNLKHYVNETVYHEAVHAAQQCKSKNISGIFGPNPIGIPKSNMPLPPNKLEDIKNSSSIFRMNSSSREHEAYYLEDKPNKVLHYVEKYCL
jgi:hypothetical protein